MFSPDVCGQRRSIPFTWTEEENPNGLDEELGRVLVLWRGSGSEACRTLDQ